MPDHVSIQINSLYLLQDIWKQSTQSYELFYSSFMKYAKMKQNSLKKSIRNHYKIETQSWTSEFN